jgi:hypothetical protein
MRKEKETIIAGTKFRITQLGFEDSIDLFVPLCKTLGPSIGALFSGLENESTQNLSDARVSSTGVTQALTELAQRLTSQDLKYAVNTLAKTTRVEREPGKWPILEPEVDLAGEFGLMFRWLAFALGVNYGSFLGEVLSGASPLENPKGQASASPNMSAGKSTVS